MRDDRCHSEQVGELFKLDASARANAKLVVGDDGVQYGFDEVGKVNLIVIPVWKLSETACDEFKALAALTRDCLDELTPPRTEGLPYELSWNKLNVGVCFGDGEENYSFPRDVLEKVVISANGQPLADALQLEGNA
ncbi:MAG: hypothetical protein AAFS11_04425 [Planctomycetota bacterium]